MSVQTAVFVLALVVVVWRFTALADRKDRVWTDERCELLNRIQRPEMIPFPSRSAAFEPKEATVDEWDRVGAIDLSDTE